MSKSPEVLAELIRNEIVESFHTGHLVMLNSDGTIYKAKGDINLPIFPRSSVKSLQASAMVRAGLNLPPKLLALTCASHSGSKMHQDAVLEILATVGLSEEALLNATDRPLGEAERLAWGSKAPTRLAMNCSGKHAGMLVTCVINGWDTKTYLQQDHPLQQAILTEIETMTGESVANKTFDGCGAPLFAITVLGLAKAIHRITVSADPIHQQIVAACRQYPEMVAGEGRMPTRMMQAVPGMFMKDGAEAVDISSLADGRTLVFKIADGSSRASGTIIEAAYKEWGVTTPDVKVNVYGGTSIVGGIRATL
jgi:L-asparaginase II